MNASKLQVHPEPAVFVYKICFHLLNIKTYHTETGSILFYSPQRPGETADVQLSIHYGKLRFKLRHHHCKLHLCRCIFKQTAPKCICIFQYWNPNSFPSRKDLQFNLWQVVKMQIISSFKQMIQIHLED